MADATAESPADEYERRRAGRRERVTARLRILAGLGCLAQLAAGLCLLAAFAEDDLDFLIASMTCLGIAAALAVGSAAVLALSWELASRRLIALGLGPWALLFVEVSAIVLLNL